MERIRSFPPDFEALAARAFREHKALAAVEARYPALREDPDFQFARQAAYTRFERVFEMV